MTPAFSAMDSLQPPPDHHPTMTHDQYFPPSHTLPLPPRGTNIFLPTRSLNGDVICIPMIVDAMELQGWAGKSTLKEYSEAQEKAWNIPTAHPDRGMPPGLPIGALYEGKIPEIIHPPEEEVEQDSMQLSFELLQDFYRTKREDLPLHATASTTFHASSRIPNPDEEPSSLNTSFESEFSEQLILPPPQKKLLPEKLLNIAGWLLRTEYRQDRVPMPHTAISLICDEIPSDIEDDAEEPDGSSLTVLGPRPKTNRGGFDSSDDEDPTRPARIKGEIISWADALKYRLLVESSLDRKGLEEWY